LKDDTHPETGWQGLKVHSPQEIADRLGGISVKSLAELIRNGGLETTTLGYAEPSRRGGPRRRLWGMTDAQLERLLSSRKRRGQTSNPS
jgi:hypothetical protein